MVKYIREGELVTGALSDLKILDFTTLLPGPYATLMLADMGAEVISISKRGKPDIVAEFPPFIAGTDISANQAWLGRNKKQLHLNLKSTKAVDIIKKLVLEYDIIIEQFRPGVMDKLGLGYKELNEINKKLIYCSISGYGQNGPLALRVGHDINYLARSGNMAASGRLNVGPVLTNMQVADISSGSLHAVVAILAAVNFRKNSGKGQYIDVSMLDGLIPLNAMDGAAFLLTGEEPQMEGQRLNGGSIYDFYETKDGRYLSVGSLEPQFFEQLCKCIGKEEFINIEISSENIAQIKSELKAIFLQKASDEWQQVFKDHDVCVEPVLSLNEALISDEHIKSRNMIVDLPLNSDRSKAIKQLGSPIKMTESPVEYKHIGFQRGHHTDEILSELGYSQEQILNFRNSNTI